MNQLLSTFYLMGFCQGIILIVILFWRHKNMNRDRFLMMALAIWSLYLLEHYLRSFLIDFPHFFGVTACFPVMVWPLLRSYLNCFSGKEGQIKWWEMIPVITAYLILFPFYIQTSDYKTNLLIHQLPLPESDLISMIILAQTLFYITLMLRRMEAYTALIQGRYSNLTEIDLGWFRYFLILTGAIWSGDALFEIIGNNSFLSILVAAFQILILYMGSYFALLQREIKIIKVTTVTNQPTELMSDHKIKYQKSGLENDEIKALFEQIDNLLIKKQLFLNSELTLSLLADEVGLSSNHLSQVINQSTHGSFYLLINQYRVTYLKELIQNNPEKPLLTLGYQSGFGSKSAFNSAFKKITGLTPSGYRKQLLVIDLK